MGKRSGVRQGLEPSFAVECRKIHVLGGRENPALKEISISCPYPKVAVYNGVGSTSDAMNFTCKKP
jgi:hypothetical protein